MPPVEQNSGDSGNHINRKRWETPVVIVASAQHQTLSNQNSGGVDVVYSSIPTSIGS
ncbi:hypothetical protein [Sphingomonas pruni]|uniref:hypothetical protein n=1 Tax=Sphingomonas pruni TaxID=40683 RepID=UPI000A5DC954|nr:hypothetical protein [Sphingomonas pruni]